MTVAGVPFALLLPALMVSGEAAAGSAGIRTHLEQGQLAWRQSCPQVPPGDECVQVTEARDAIDMIRGHRHRGLGCVRTRLPRRVRAFPREPRLVRKAQRHFIVVARSAGADPEARARALFYLAEKRREDFLAVPVRDKASQRWLKLNMLERAKRAYLEAIAVGHPLWVVAAHARMGSLYQDFEGGGPVPRPVEPIFYGADWLHDEAVAWFKRCVRQARDTADYAADWSNICWRALTDYEPAEYPQAHEIGLASDHAPSAAVGLASLRTRLDAVR